jgi:hypothetical protein
MEPNKDDVMVYSVAMATLTICIFREMELRNYDPQQKKLVQNLFAQVVDRAKTDFPLDEISAAVMNIPPVANSLIKMANQRMN